MWHVFHKETRPTFDGTDTFDSVPLLDIVVLEGHEDSGGWVGSVGDIHVWVAVTPLKPRVLAVLDKFAVHLQKGNTECSNKLYLDT